MAENYICVNCKCIFEYKPYDCPNCERKTFEVTNYSIFDTKRIIERRDYLTGLEERNRVLTEALQKIKSEIITQGAAWATKLESDILIIADEALNTAI